MRTRTILVMAIAGMLAPGSSTRADEPGASRFPKCIPLSSTEVVVGEVACQRIDSAAIGGVSAFTYYVPPACGPASRCPTLYLLHGLGFDYRTMVGTRESPSAWVRALTSGPPVDPNRVADPWRYADPAGWIPLEPIDFILVAPHGHTVPGGYGLKAEMESFWVDWNPRYALGGDSQRYATPPPRFASFIVDELIPWVESHLPASSGRAGRAISGADTGGYGSYLFGLQRPDLWSSVGSVSGDPDVVPVPGPDPIHGANDLPGVSRPELPYMRLPGLRPAAFDELLLNVSSETGVTYALGDPGSDPAYIRGNMPLHLATNGRASAGGQPSLYLRANVGDAVPRRAEDAANPFAMAVEQAVEAILLANNLRMEAELEYQGVPHEFEIHPGTESNVYRNPFLRAHLAALYAHVRRRDGGGSPPPPPASFDYRSIARSFAVWGWSFGVERKATEFLNLLDVSCRGLTLQGTGVVTVTVPTSCGTGLDGKRVFDVDLGPGSPTDEQAGASAVPGYSTRVSLELSSLE